MADGRHPPAALVRAEFEGQPGEVAPLGDVARPLATWERINNNPFAWRVLILVILAAVWEIYARWLNNPLIFPAFSEMAAALWDATVRGPLIERTLTTIRVLLMGYAAGIALAAVFTTLAVSTRLGTHLLSTLTAMFNPLPAIALLPLALLWFGLGIPSLMFVIVHSVLGAVALNTHTVRKWGMQR
jgi:NitT/TauT family transport system permease protein